MVMVYQIKENGFLGEAREIDPTEGIDWGWTYTAPPGAGTFKWVDCAWVAAQEPAPFKAAPFEPPPPAVPPPADFEYPAVDVVAQQAGATTNLMPQIAERTS